MATVKLGTTKSANRLISYCEKRADVREGLHCDPEYAKTQMRVTRELYGKTDNIQAHHVIQSFKPEEVTPEQANQIGLDLAKQLAPGHECAVYTHTDKAHVHNHIVVNSVSFEDGHKLHLHGSGAIEKTRDISDTLCKEHGLSIVKEPARERYTLPEKAIIEKGDISWKDELRQAIDRERSQVKTYEELKNNLREKYRIEVQDNGKHITYRHPDFQRAVRGNKLGANYEREGLQHGLGRQAPERGQERTATGNRAAAGNYPDRDRAEGRNKNIPATRSAGHKARELEGPAENIRERATAAPSAGNKDKFDVASLTRSARQERNIARQQAKAVERAKERARAIERANRARELEWDRGPSR